MAGKVLLTISILISNRPDTVRKCLDSIQPLLKEVPSELILTDTGCGEEVRAIIEEYTDHIIDFEWCKDFAKARNVGLKAAKGEWFLFLDDDEWFDDVTEIVKFFTSGEYKAYGYGLYVQRNYMDKDAVYHSDLIVARMIKLGPGIEFMYSIHECFNTVPGKVKNFDAFVHHYGYVYDSVEEAKAHAMRNVELLAVEHKKSPRNMKHTLQLAQEYNSIREWQKSLDVSLEGMRTAESGPVELDFCTDSIYANAVQNYVRLGRAEDAIKEGERYLHGKRPDPYATALIAGILAAQYLKRNELEKAMDRMSLYEKIYKDYCRDPLPFVYYETTITSNCFDMLQRSVTLGCGVQAALLAGKPAKALRWFRKIDLESGKAFVSTEMITFILRRMAESVSGTENRADAALGTDTGSGTDTKTSTASQGAVVQIGQGDETAVLKEMCNTILKRKDMEDVIVKEILEIFRTGEELCALAGLESDHWVFALANALQGQDREKNASIVWKHMEESFRYIMRYRLMETLDNAGCDIGKVLAASPYAVWDRTLTDYAKDCTEVEMHWWHGWFTRLPDSEEFKKPAWERLMLYRLLTDASAAESKQGAEKAQDLLWEYSKTTVSLCEKIYLPEVLAGDSDILSAKHRVAFLARDLRQAMDEGRYREAIGMVRQIKELAPELAGVVKSILLRLQKETEVTEEQKAAADEMQVLGIQIKLKIRQLTQANRISEALTVAKQLAGILPGDEELRRTIEKLEKQCAGMA